eukprot:6201051-Pleurochrysis_carterae.AAC.1
MRTPDQHAARIYALASLATRRLLETIAQARLPARVSVRLVLSEATDVQNNTEQLLYGRARSESVSTTDSFNHARLSQACSCISDSPRRIYQSYRPGGHQEPTKLYKILSVESRKLARARGLGRQLGDSALTSRQQPSQASIQELGKRSASAPQVRMRCKCNLGNHACD